MLRIIYRVASYIALAVMGVRWLAFLWRNRAVLREAEVVVTMNAPRAFGTLFATIDDARRIYKGRRLVFLYHREPVGQNPLLDECFIDVTLRHCLRRKLCFDFAGRALELPPDEWHDPMTYAFTTYWLRLFGRPGVESRCTFDVWHQLPLTEAAAALLPRVTSLEPDRPGPFRAYSRERTGSRIGELNVCNELHMYAGWNCLRAEVEAPRMRLPARYRDPVFVALEGARGGRSAKLCGLHTRFGGSWDNVQRDGTPVESYIPAIRELVRRGNQVMIQGDRSFHPRFMATFDGMLVDAVTLGIDRSVFHLFCGTESDIFIGDWPVAPQMAATNGIPTLVVNAWPVGWAVNGTTVYYRGIRGADGQRWPYKKVLELGALLSADNQPHPFPELYGHDEALIDELRHIEQITLDEEEILAAVVRFLDDLATGGPPPALHAELVNLMPVWTAFRVAPDCRLSPAWIDRYVKDRRADAGAVSTR